mmetsp:Transcript_12070/g.17628  ORF Transcript_12070/g.17628 Transcript_12070/m.17628 type:complete len:286 (+) Transcript_12070:151-1008(+)
MMNSKSFISLLLTTLVTLRTVTSFVIPTPTNGAVNVHVQTSTSLSFGLGNNNKNENEVDNKSIKSIKPDTKPSKKTKDKFLGSKMRRSLFLSTALAGLTNLGLAYAAPPNFKRIPTQFIAALGDPDSNTGTNVNEWGLWTVDPGPRGVWLRDYKKDVVSKNNRAPAGWNFDQRDWWLEEHGLIMEAPTFPLDSGRYLVTGGRLVTTVLDVKMDGSWSLEKGKLFDVTHLPCRSARYTPATGVGDGSPLTAKESDFPVKPGAEMPRVEGCDKLDYAVLFVIGKEVV